eukprot:CAMPEP_0118958684 /NCGR_PEP_ID=MMETSP1169-20130426/62746_1 /TAXON_ID=36882 /ORGANISM="Pyramimonas obovata, Strain CCMP722" /LENGTH=160 /DNA_ID=CAMNT_0006906809 /DNA_START=464 /DNA_END=946 /DNA_ORIENTATION=-
MAFAGSMSSCTLTTHQLSLSGWRTKGARENTAKRPNYTSAPCPAIVASWFGGKKKEEETKGKTKQTPPAGKKTGFNIFGGGGRSKGGGSGATCRRCKGAQYIDCPTCDGKGKFSGRGKGPSAKGNIFERNKCFDCQGFSMVACPACSKGRGLTPEQRGER